MCKICQVMVSIYVYVLKIHENLTININDQYINRHAATVGEVGATPKLLSLGIKKWVKRLPA